MSFMVISDRLISDESYDLLKELLKEIKQCFKLNRKIIFSQHYHDIYLLVNVFLTGKSHADCYVICKCNKHAVLFASILMHLHDNDHRLQFRKLSKIDDSSEVNEYFYKFSKTSEQNCHVHAVLNKDKTVENCELDEQTLYLVYLLDQIKELVYNKVSSKILAI